MKKTIVGGILGGLVYFIWGAVSWMVLPWHMSTMRNLSNEDTVVAALRQNVTESGVYVFPAWPTSSDKASCEAFTAKHKQGPIGTMIYHAEGLDPVMAPAMARGFVLNALCAWLIAHMLSKTAYRSYGCRVGFVSIGGLFAGLTTHGMYWNWMLFPCNYTAVMLFDTFIGWTLAGLVIAAIVKPAGATGATIPGVVEPG
jgi:hypothetical protein